MNKHEHDTPLTTNFNLVFNITAIKKWLKDKKEIPPLDSESWDYDSHEEVYKITMLPHDPFVFYHNEVNMFSPGFHGSDHVDGIKLEWNWHDFGFVCMANQRPIFIVPDREINHLLRTGEHLSKDECEEEHKGEIIPAPIDDDEFCQEILQKTSFSDGVSHSNALAYMTVGVLSGSGYVDYSVLRD